jgi:lipopolysaccharide biosynthesis glycosyltransferase/glycosyltransferase involved in cell wall biosynthesis
MFSQLYKTNSHSDLKATLLHLKAKAVKNKTVCLVSDDLAKMEPTAETAAAWFIQNGWKVTWLDLSFTDTQADKLHEHQASRKLEHVKLAGKFSEAYWYAPMQSLCAYHWLKQHDFDLIVFQHGFGAAFFSCMAKKAGLAFLETPLIVWADDPYAYWLETAEFLPLAVRTDAELDHFERQSVAYADGVFFSHARVFEWMKAADWPLGNDETRLGLLADKGDTSWSDWLNGKMRRKSSAPALSAEDVRISVCVTSYNRPDYLRETLRALLKQTIKDFEVVVDDASTDPAVDQLREEMKDIFAERDWIWNRTPNMGMPASRNSAAQVARGTHLLFKDDDNLSYDDEVEIFAKAARHSGADVITCVISKHYLSDDATSPVARFPARPHSGLPVQNIAYLYNGPVLATGMMFNAFGDANSLVRKSTFQKLGGRVVNNTSFYEDWEFHARAAMEGYKFVALPESLFQYRVHANSANKDIAKIFKGLVSVVGLYAQHVPPYLYAMLLAASHNFISWYPNNPTRYPDPLLYPEKSKMIETHAMFHQAMPKSSPHIVMGVTDKHVRQACATLASLLACSKSPLHLSIIASLKGANKEALKKVAEHFGTTIHFIPYKASKLLPPTAKLGDAPDAMYWSLLLPSHLPATVDRVVLLDCDVLVRRDVSELWNQDTCGHILAAVPDQMIYPPAKKSRCGYFNPAVMLIDLKAWRKNKITEQALEALNKTEHDRDIYQLWSQGPLNQAVGDRWTLLSPMWNWVNDSSRNDGWPHANGQYVNQFRIDGREFELIKASPGICRFVGGMKPWNMDKKCISIWGNEYLAYLKLGDVLSRNDAKEKADVTPQRKKKRRSH